MIESSNVFKDEYRLGRVCKVHPDGAGLVRTVTVEYKKKDSREGALQYKSKKLEREKMAVQRLSPLVTMDEQSESQVSS